MLATRAQKTLVVTILFAMSILVLRTEIVRVNKTINCNYEVAKEIVEKHSNALENGQSTFEYTLPEGFDEFVHPELARLATVEIPSGDYRKIESVVEKVSTYETKIVRNTVFAAVLFCVLFLWIVVSWFTVLEERFPKFKRVKYKIHIPRKTR